MGFTMLASETTVQYRTDLVNGLRPPAPLGPSLGSRPDDICPAATLTEARRRGAPRWVRQRSSAQSQVYNRLWHLNRTSRKAPVPLQRKGIWNQCPQRHLSHRT